MPPEVCHLHSECHLAGITEELSYKSFSRYFSEGLLHTSPILLAGDIGSASILWKNYEPSARKKYPHFCGIIL
jgi:hypothetical protein